MYTHDVRRQRQSNQDVEDIMGWSSASEAKPSERYAQNSDTLHTETVPFHLSDGLNACRYGVVHYQTHGVNYV